MASILIIDDDRKMCKALSLMVRIMGHEVSCASALRDGLEEASSKRYDVVFLDVWMPDGNGLEVLPRIRETPSSPEVVVITGFGNPDGAELAIEYGAWDYVQKPFSKKEVGLLLSRALQYREEKGIRKPVVSLRREGIIGNSPAILRCLDVVAKAANSDANFLITGETGTGKELFAQAVHDNSPRSDKRFVVVDCAALPETLVESVLFGHERGAFTGADRGREGLIKQADGGTLFLDEVGELPLSVQKALLRVLQERRFRPVGSKQETTSDFRLVAATNRDLDDMVQHTEFRHDLLFRLRSFTIELPPLRQRREDIKELAMYHAAKFCEHYSIGTKGFSPEFLEALIAYDWPGNVRELLNVLERIIISYRYNFTLFPKHLPTRIRIQLARASVLNGATEKSPLTSTPAAETLPTLRDVRKAVDKEYLRDLIAITKGDAKNACRISGLSRSRLYELLQKYEISISELRKGDTHVSSSSILNDSPVFRTKSAFPDSLPPPYRLSQPCFPS